MLTSGTDNPPQIRPFEVFEQGFQGLCCGGSLEARSLLPGRDGPQGGHAGVCAPDAEGAVQGPGLGGRGNRAELQNDRAKAR